MENEDRAGDGARRGQPPPAGSVWRRAGAVIVRILLDLVVIDAAVETWLSASPVRDWVVVPVALYFLLTIWLVSQGARPGGSGWFMQPLAPIFLLLIVLLLTTGTRDAMVHGMVLLQQPTPRVLAGVTLLVVVLAGLRLAVADGLPCWLWILFAALTIYAAAALGIGVMAGTPYPELLHGRGFWLPLPFWMQGAFLGAFVLVPLALVGEIGIMLARLVRGSRMRWSLLFALGLFVAIHGASV